MGRYGFLALALLALGCQKGEECTKARLLASDVWKSIVTQAGTAKNGWSGFDELSDAQKAESVKNLRDKPGNGGFSRAGRSDEYHMIGSRRSLESFLLSHLLHPRDVHERVDFAFD